jgi:capsular exopolysaccharide synthesis family protein
VTLSQIIGVLWQRKWIILSVVLISLLAANWALQRQEPLYTSTASARTNLVVSDAMLGGQLAGVPVDFDTSTISTPRILEPAAVAAGERDTDLRSAIVVNVEENGQTQRIYVTATGPTPESARARATGVLSVYSNYLQGQIDDAVVTVTERRDQALKDAQKFQTAAAKDPSDAITASRLADALSQYNNLGAQIEAINQAGAPLTSSEPAGLGAPVGASSTTILLATLVAALIAGIGLALLRDQFDHRLRGEHEVESLTQLPVLGELNYDRALARSGERLPVERTQATAVGEGLRSLRASVQVLLKEEHAAVVVTSVEPGDGKSFISANLALAWARAGKKVILVGGDLRRPSLQGYFGEAGSGPGLSELLQDALAADVPLTPANIQSRLNATAYRGLRVLPAGAIPRDPADLLANSTVGEVIAELRKLADIVVIDSPPAMRLVDASLLAVHADGVAVVAWQKRTLRAHLVETVEALHLNDVPLLGVVVNGVHRRHPRSYTPYYIHTTPKAPWSQRLSRGAAEPQAPDARVGKSTVAAAPDEGSRSNSHT